MIFSTVKNLVFLAFGAMIAAFALEGFLVPNNIIDGGVVGISIMASTITGAGLGIFVVVLNIPFMFFAYKQFGKRFLAYTIFSILVLAFGITLLDGWNGHVVTGDLLLATVFGGVILGVGVGLILRHNGSLDGTEILAIVLAKKYGFSIGEIIMFFNIFVFSAAGFLYGWERAMYSILAYFIAYKVIDIVLEGLNESKSVMVVTDFAKEMGDKIIQNMDVGVTYIDAIGGYSGVKKQILYCVISRLWLIKLKSIVNEVDPCAFIAIENVHEVEGVRVNKKCAGGKPKA